MKKYYLDKNPNQNSNHEVHVELCDCLPPAEDQISLGFQNNADSAIAGAKKMYPEVSDKIQGCENCINIISGDSFFS